MFKPGDEYNTSALRTQLNAVPLVGRTIDEVVDDVKTLFRQHGVLMVVSSSKKVKFWVFVTKVLKFLRPVFVTEKLGKFQMFLPVSVAFVHDLPFCYT